MSRSCHQMCLAAARARPDRAYNRRAGDKVKSDRAISVENLLWDGSQLSPPDRGTLALQAFTQGNGFLPGQIIDRCA